MDIIQTIINQSIGFGVCHQCVLVHEFQVIVLVLLEDDGELLLCWGFLERLLLRGLLRNDGLLHCFEIFSLVLRL